MSGASFIDLGCRVEASEMLVTEIFEILKDD